MENTIKSLEVYGFRKVGTRQKHAIMFRNWDKTMAIVTPLGHVIQEDLCTVTAEQYIEGLCPIKPFAQQIFVRDLTA